MSAEAVLALWVIGLGCVFAAVLAAGSAVLQRHADRANAADEAAVEQELGREVSALASERHPR